MVKCDFCKNDFSNISVLNSHQKTAKYCLKIQGRKPSLFSCEYCEKNFAQGASLERHLNKCKKFINIKEIEKIDEVRQHYEEKLLREQEKLEQQRQNFEEKLREQKEKYEEKLDDQRENYEYKIQTLKESYGENMETYTETRGKLYDIAVMGVQKSTTTNNNKIYNDFKPITHESISEFANTLTIEDIEQGTRGYAKFLVDGPLKDNIACSDYSRKIIKYKQVDGRIFTDPEGVSILKLIGGALSSKNKELITGVATKLKNKETDVPPEMVLQILSQLSDCNIGIQQARDGIKTPFTMDLVKEICSLII